jgi:hypothetical protein
LGPPAIGFCAVSQAEHYERLVRFLEANRGHDARIEIGAPAHDLPDHDHVFAKLFGTLGEFRTFEDPDRPGRIIGFVPIGPKAESTEPGFHVDQRRLRNFKEHAPDLVKAWFDDYYVTILI